MCDDHADVWNEKWRIARKLHKCHECGHCIATGTNYLEIRSLFDGRWDTTKWCSVCQAHWSIYRQFNDGCVMATGLRDFEAEFDLDAQDRFVLIDGRVADQMREQFTTASAPLPLAV